MDNDSVFKKELGFTLIELLVAIAVASIVIAIVSTFFAPYRGDC